MSGPFGSSQWMYSSGGFYPTEIEQSLRFNDDDSAYLSRTPASAGNRKTWTWSGWVKLCDMATGYNGGLFGAGDITIGGGTALNYRDNGFDFYLDGSFGGRIITTQVFRDPSAWYHIVLTLDTTNATSSDRLRLYINGERVTAFSTNSQPALNYEGDINSTSFTHYIGLGYLQYLDGYLAEVNFIDGQALDPTDFGEFKSGVWVAKSYAGSYGTNGFYLNFSDSANIGDDLSGNANDWTANNLVATDVVLDSPTNNFAVWNPLVRTVSTISNGNLQAATPLSNTDWAALVRSNFAIPQSGKWYFEVFNGGGTLPNQIQVGIASRYINDATIPTNYAWYNNTNYFAESGSASGKTAPTTNDVIGCAVDVDAGSITWYLNNTSQGSFSYTVVGKELFFIVGDGSNSAAITAVANFGQDSSFAGNKTPQGNTDDNGVGDFYYAPPAGYLALCTANLPDPVIDPAQDDVPSDYFNSVIYTGNSSTQNVSVGFQPDFYWIKARSAALSHYLLDRVRGDGKVLFSNLTNAEYDGSTLDPLSTDADGLVLPNGLNVDNYNLSGRGYVAWNWLAGNGTSSNTDGSITSNVSVNQKAGFSVVGWTGTGANATVGHGLSAKPKVVIIKNRDFGYNWPVYVAEEWDQDPSSGLLFLADTGAGYNDATYFGTAPTSSVFSVGTAGQINQSGSSLIAYCFAEVEGYSKFGSYTGNGSADGPFAHCGFRPAFVMVKRTDTTGNWNLYDTSRDPSNSVQRELYANLSNAEGTYPAGQGIDILSNGFKLRTTGANQNASGGTYIFMAFAEMPAKYSLGR